jgi:hypothetical protein
MPTSLVSSIIKRSDLENQTLIDPVSKFRVSMPETLIDTDFEYGLQSTKWETLELVNNIPTFFFRDGETSVDISDVVVLRNSFFITVTTKTAHGFSVSTPFVIVGLTSSTAEGSYVVLGVPSTTTFVYKAKGKQTRTGSIYDQYSSVLYPGRLFQSTQYSIDNINIMETDNGTKSKIVIQTKFPHGFSLNTAFILANGILQKAVSFDAAALDATNTLVTTYDVVTTDNNPDGSGFTLKRVVPYYWQSKKTVFFDPNNVDTTNSYLTIANHSLTNDTVVMYVPPVGDTAVGGLLAYKAYVVSVVDSNNVFLRNITSTQASGLVYKAYSGYFNDSVGYFGSNTPISSNIVTNINAKTALGYPVNTPRISFEIYGYFRASTTGTWTFFLNTDDASYLWIGDTAISGYTTANALVKNGGIHTLTKVSATISLTSGVLYPIRIQYGNNLNNGNVVVSFSGPGVAETSNGAGYYFYENTPYTLSPTKITLTSGATNAFGRHALLKAYLVTGVNAVTDLITISMNSSNNTDAPLLANDTLYVFSGDATKRGFAIDDVVPSTSNANISQFTRYFVRGTPTVGATSSTLQVSSFPGGIVQDTKVNTVMGVTWVIPGSTILEYEGIYSQNHGLATDDAVVYTVVSGTGPTGLTASATYYVERISNNMFRLKSALGLANIVDLQSVGNGTIRFTKTVSNPNANTIFFDGHELVPWTPVVYNNGGNPNIPGLVNGSTYYVFDCTADRFKLSSTNFPTVTPVDITNVGSGTHTFTSTGDATSGDYRITDVSDTTTFSLGCNFNIPFTSYTVNPRAVVVLGSNAIYLPGHKMRTGASVYYDANGNTAIGGLTTATTYFVIRVDSSFFRLATTFSNAVSGSAVALSSYGTGSNHIMRFSSVCGEVYRSQTATLASGSTQVNISGVDVLGAIRIGDKCRVEVPSSVQYNITTLDTANDILTLSSAHGLSDGSLVFYYNATGSITGLTSARLYYVRVTGLTTSQLQLFNTAANATSNTNRIDINTGTSPLGTITKFAPTVYGISSVDTTNDIVGFSFSHALANGNTLLYTSATPIGGLTSGLIYYVRVTGLTSNQVQLFNTATDATNNTNRIDITSSSTVGTFTWIAPGTVFEADVVDTKSTGSVQVATAPSVNILGNLILTSSLFFKNDANVSHRSFDGGVMILPATNPDSQIVRQTRRYFRYQSGKGMQMSKAVNFSAPIDIELLSRDGSTAYAQTKTPHRMGAGVNVTISGVQQTQNLVDYWNGTYDVATIIDDYTFTFPLSAVPPETVAGGYPQVVVNSWTNSALRAGLFDDQNGLFFEYDGTKLYAVRRNSIKQLSGTCTVTFGSSLVQGSGSSYNSQLTVGDRIVIKGQTYKVVSVVNDNYMYVQPPYRGASTTNVVITRTEDVKTAQENFSIDPCDGTGPTGYMLNIHRIQMVYIDYSWYGAGKVRFGFKDRTGAVRYVHEYIHNNNMNEAYMRSGNLPARYEVVTTGNPSWVPALMHWGTSVIMDGRYDNDAAYLFTAAGILLSYSGSDTFTFNATIVASDLTTTYNIFDPGQAKVVTAYRITANNPSTTVYNMKPGVTLFGTNISLGTQTVSSPVRVNASTAYIYITLPPTGTQTNSAITVNPGASDFPPNLIPLVSIRLAPSADSGRPGAIGSREIINRMQLRLKSVGILNSHDTEIKLLLNAYPFTKAWQRVTPPSLSQLIYHNKNDAITGGTQIYSWRVPGGTPDSAGRRNSQTTTTTLDELIDLGNCIMGGDDIFPNGPDLLTVCATIIDTSNIAVATPVTIAGRVTWTESQA